jgi:hypothetical protein
MSEGNLSYGAMRVSIQPRTVAAGPNQTATRTLGTRRRAGWSSPTTAVLIYAGPASVFRSAVMAKPPPVMTL